jgi:galactitol-specific phosphotransferase system IIB component
MSIKVAVEQNLTPVKDYLSKMGYSVDTVDMSREFSKSMDKYDAIIVTGMNKNFLGVEDVNTGAVIIDAKGLTAEQVVKEMENRLS